jgi:hypothetical protein
MELRPATAMGDGSVRQCHRCTDDLPVGSACALDTRGFECHPECLDPRVRPRGASLSPTWLADAAHARDLGDQVADLLDQRRGRAPTANATKASAPPATPAPDFGDAVADAFDRLRGRAVAP